MYPELHHAVFSELESAIFQPPSFHRRYSSKGSDLDYSTNVMGHFICPNTKCSTAGWGSKKIAIQIRRYPSSNEYNALVFNQRCRNCDELGGLILDETSYVERVVYRLKKWAGVKVTPPEFRRNPGEPHRSDLCEGCKVGRCSFARERDVFFVRGGFL